MVRLLGSSLWLCAALLPLAGAEGLSVDVEMLNPTFSAGGPAGVESPFIAGKGALRMGLLYQYQRDPVILYLYNEEAGSVIANRRSAALGVAWDLSDRFSLRGSIPVAWQAGTDQPDYAYEGLGLGDISLGGRALLAAAGPLSIGARADLLLPVGTKQAYLGEPRLRARLGLSGLVEVGPAAGLVEATFLSRPSRDTGLDFIAESAIELNAGAMLDVWPDKVAMTTTLLTRTGATHLGEPGGERGSELLVGMQLHPFGELDQIDLGVGRGLARGVGTTAFRYYVGYTYVRPPKPTPVVPQVVVEERPPEPVVPDQIVIEEKPPEPWKEGELARIQQDQIVIRDPIQFEFATANVLPESLPTLVAVAQILNEHAEIGHIVIEGHASEEGSYLYNYDLSNLRARSIWMELIKVGVHPTRMSYRGMGEVVPKNLGTDEVSLAENRRVEFHIVQRLRPEDGYPAFPDTTPLPWTGERVPVVQPKEPPPPEAPKTVEQQLEELLSPDNFRDDLDDEVPSPEGDGEEAPP